MHIPVKEHLVIFRDEHYSLLDFDLLDTQIKVVGELYKDDDGQVKYSNMRNYYEKLPTSYTKLAFKFYHDVQGAFPFVELKCSPAKIMQGHNVYGSDFILMGALEMLGFLFLTYPQFYDMLDIQKTEIKQLDITYSARLKNNQQVDKCLDYMRNVSTQHIRKSQKVCANTVYFGSERCKRFGRKVYGKYSELMNQIKEKEREAKRGDTYAQKVLDVMMSEKVQKFAYGQLRFETTVKAYALKEMGYPTNLIELIKFQRENKDFLKKIWIKANQQLFDALQGEMMMNDDDSVYENLCKCYGKVTPSGRISYRKAMNLFNFYRSIRADGVDVLKARYSSTQFYQHMKDLIDAGYSKSYLQNLHTENRNNIVQFVDLIKVDFSNQLPEDWQEPYSTFFPEAKKLLQMEEKPQFKQVA